jgi:2-oxoglutarate dehydrogenase complex dehydrogenase (E1) component-like enzyme
MCLFCRDIPDINLSVYGLDKVPANQQIPLAGLLNIGKDTATLGEIVDHLKKAYCGKIATEFFHHQVWYIILEIYSFKKPEQKRWFADQVEALPRSQISVDEKRRAYKLISEAEVFDHFMQKKFPFVKR